MKISSPKQEEKYAKAIISACRILENSEESPDLKTVANAVGISPFYFHRIFKRTTGLTPRAFALAHRSQRVREKLLLGATVTEVIYGAGFNSNSRFYEKSGHMLGMQPKAFRNGGSGATIRFAIGECSLGAILVASTEKGVCAILMDDSPEVLIEDLQDRFPQAHLIGGDKDYEQLVAKVVGFIEAPRLGLDLPLDIRGTVFQQRVWQALAQIPPASTASYAEIARRIGSPKAVRAVAGACAANAIAVAIPCHRVVRTDGQLSGYRWGVERKRALLKREAACSR